MEIRMDSADVQSLACKDTFVSLRVGDCQKQSRLVATRTYKFAADTQDAKTSFGRIEVFKRIGAHTVAFDTLSGEGGQEVEVSCSDPELAALRLSLFVNKTAVVADGKEPAKERNSQKKKQMEDAKRYLDEHALEELIAVAMREVIRKRPEEPRQFLCDQIIAAKSKAKAPPKAAEKPAENSAPPPVPEVSAMKSAPPAEDNARVAACAVLQEANASGILSAELSKFAKAVEESGPPPVPSAEHKSAAKETVANENEDLQAADEAAKSAPPLVASSSSKNGKSLPAHAWAAMHGRFPQKSAPAAQKSAPAAQDNARVAACAVLQEANASGILSAELSKSAKVASSSSEFQSLPAHAWAAMHGRFPQKSAPAAQKSAPAAQDNARVAACAVLQEASASGILSAELSKFAKVVIPPPKEYTCLKHKPSAATWMMGLPRKDPIPYKHRPSVGSWYMPLPRRQAQARAAEAEAEAWKVAAPKRFLPHRPSCGWLQQIPFQVEKPWYYQQSDPASPQGKFVMELQGEIAKRDKEIENMQNMLRQLRDQMGAEAFTAAGFEVS